ncbi:hypothetical protein ABZ557_10795 [Streptomyces sp. NPDC019645]|uniref:hypothetical protein n=1 Tax=Streptomyces sp. NPDC019645 TaxID=3154786 RepID=UPI0033D2B9B3
MAVTAAGMALGWWSGQFRIGPEEYGLPSVAPGPLLPYLAAWTAVGLVAASVLRAAAARVPVHAPETIAVGVVWLGTRLSLGRRPEWPLLALMATIALAAAAGWSLMALRPGSRGRTNRARNATPTGQGPSRRRAAGPYAGYRHAK